MMIILITLSFIFIFFTIRWIYTRRNDRRIRREFDAKVSSCWILNLLLLWSAAILRILFMHCVNRFLVSSDWARMFGEIKTNQYANA